MLFINEYLTSSDTVTSGHRTWTYKLKRASKVWNSQIKVVKLFSWELEGASYTRCCPEQDRRYPSWFSDTCGHVTAHVRAEWTHTGTKLNQQGWQSHQHRTARKSLSSFHLFAPRPVGFRPLLEGFGEAEGRCHPEDAGGSNAGTKWFRVRERVRACTVSSWRYIVESAPQSKGSHREQLAAGRRGGNSTTYQLPTKVSSVRWSSSHLGSRATGQPGRSICLVSAFNSLMAAPAEVDVRVSLNTELSGINLQWKNLSHC